MIQIILLTGNEIVAKLNDGALVLDVGCGRGHALNLMAKAFPNSKFIGYDLSEEGIESGRKESKEMNLTNVEFEVRDVDSLTDNDKFDMITAFDTIHDQAHPTNVLSKIHGALKQDGTFLMQDIAASSNTEENIQNPLAPALYTFSTFHLYDCLFGARGRGFGYSLGASVGRTKV